MDWRCKNEERENIPIRRQLRKLVRAIQDEDVKEEHILNDLLAKFIQYEKKNHTNYKGKHTYYVESYLYYEKKDKQEGLSLLHLAVSCGRIDVATRLVQFAPNLGKIARMEKCFIGQTPFHVAVAGRHLKLVYNILEAADMKNEAEQTGMDEVAYKRELLSAKARGHALKGSKMTGELPLSIAVVNYEVDMIVLLLMEGADALLGDSEGNTVLHSIVMYVYYFPEKNLNTDQQHYNQAYKSFTWAYDHYIKAQQPLGTRQGHEIWKVVEEVSDEKLSDGLNIKSNSKFLRTQLQKRNDKQMTPMQLACAKGLKDLFQYFVQLDGINRFNTPHWGVDDVYCYDVTELDTVRWRALIKEETEHKYPERIQNRRVIDEEQQIEEDNCEYICFRIWTNLGMFNKRLSGLQLIYNLPFKRGVDFMTIDVVEQLVHRKWEYYTWWFYGFFIFHLIFMIVLTYNTVVKIETFGLKTLEFGSGLDTRFVIFNVLNMGVGMLYMLQEIVRRFYFRLTWPPKYFHHSSICRLIFLLFGLMLFVDAVWNFLNTNNYMRYLAVFFGWLGMIFFFRAIKPFSYHTATFLEIISGDFLKFLPVAFIIFVPFIPTAYEVFGYNNLNSTSETVITLFKLMNGLTDIENLSETPKSGFSTTVFFLYVIFTNIIILQTLIALMTNNQLSQVNKCDLYEVHILSVVVFFESLLPIKWMKGLGEMVQFVNFNGDRTSRYHFDVSRTKYDEDKKVGRDVRKSSPEKEQDESSNSITHYNKGCKASVEIYSPKKETHRW